MSYTPAEPNPSPVELVRELDFRSLTELSDTLVGDWRVVAAGARLRRERALDDLRTFIPERIETPNFDSGEVGAYIDQGRKINNSSPQLADSERLRREKAAISELADSYIRRPDTLRRLTGVAGHADLDSLSDFFAANLYGLTVTARSMAIRSFQVRRNAVLRTHFPRAPLMERYSFLEHIKGLPITGEQVQQIGEEIATLPHRAPQPDFFQLSVPDQQLIVDTLGREWEEMYSLLREHGPRLLERGINLATAPLTYLSVRDLERAIADNPIVPPDEICHAFLRSPHRFHGQYGRLEELKRRAQMLEAGRQALIASGLMRGQAVEAGASGLSKNQHEIRKLLDDPEVNSEVQNMPFGAAVALTAPATETSGPQLIYRPQLSSTIDKNLQLLGRTLYEELPGHSPKGVTLWRWESFNVGETLRAGFPGAMSDLVMTRLPVSQEDLETRLPGTRLRAEDVSEIVFTVNMRSSGRGAGPAMLRLMLVVHTGTPKDTIAKSSWKPRSTGANLVESLRAEAAAVAQVVKAHNLRNPYSGGAPGLGKR